MDHPPAAAETSGVTSGDNRPEDEIEEGFAVMVISSYLPEDHGAVGSHPGGAQGKIIELTKRPNNAAVH